MPPTVSKVRTNQQKQPSVSAPTKTTGILSRVRPVSQVECDHIHMLLWGKNRVGKTVLACHFPKPLLLIALDQAEGKGAKSVKRLEGIDVLEWDVDIKSVEEIEALGAELTANNPYKTVVIDSGTSLDEIVLAKICGWKERAEMLAVGHTRPGAKVSMDQYTERSERMRQILRPFLDLPCHVVVTCNEKDHNPQEGNRKSAMARGMHLESFFGAQMGGGTTKWMQDNCNQIVQLFLDKEIKVTEEERTLPGPKKEKYIHREEEETGRIIRRLRLKLHPNFSAGIRTERMDYENLPEFADGETPQELFDNFYKIVTGE